MPEAYLHGGLIPSPERKSTPLRPFASDQTARSLAGDVGVQLEKAWVFVSDERTREDHAAMDSGDYIPLDEDFDVGGEAMEYPGDPSGSAENVINCRCSVVRRVAV